MEKHQIVLSLIMLITLQSKVKDVSGAHYLTWEVSLFYCYFPFGCSWEQPRNTKCWYINPQLCSRSSRGQFCLMPLCKMKRENHMPITSYWVSILPLQPDTEDKGLAFPKSLRHLDIWLLLKVSRSFAYLFLENHLRIRLWQRTPWTCLSGDKKSETFHTYVHSSHFFPKHLPPDVPGDAVPVKIDALFYSWVNMSPLVKILEAFNFWEQQLLLLKRPWLNETSALPGDNLNF